MNNSNSSGVVNNNFKSKITKPRSPLYQNNLPSGVAKKATNINAAAKVDPVLLEKRKSTKG